MSKERIESKWREIQRLESQYGTSIRPAWVGEEIGILYYEIMKLLTELKIPQTKPLAEYFDENGNLK